MKGKLRVLSRRGDAEHFHTAQERTVFNNAMEFIQEELTREVIKRYPVVTGAIRSVKVLNTYEKT